MKKFLTTVLLALSVGFCPADESHLRFEWGKGDVPTIPEEPHVSANFKSDEIPRYAAQEPIELSFGVDSVTHVFHFTRLWWLRDRAQRATARGDEAVDELTTVYEIVAAEVMNDIMWLGAPRELLILDEPE